MASESISSKSQKYMTVTILSIIDAPKTYTNVASCTMLTKSGVIQVLPGHQQMVTAMQDGYIKIEFAESLSKGNSKKEEMLQNISALVKVTGNEIQVFKIIA